MLLINNSMESSTSKEPICFVDTDECGNLKINPHLLDFLHNIQQPSLFVSLCGLDHDCKDSILIQLLGSKTSEFYFASARQRGAKGLRLWDTLLEKTASDGTAYNVLLLYDEGIEASDQTEAGATKIFALAVLLSSLFMNNQVCFTKRTKLEQVGGIVMTGPVLAGITTSFLNALNSGEISSLHGTKIYNSKKPGNDVSSEMRLSNWTSIDDKMELLHKQIESSEKIKTEYQKHYEQAIDDLKNLSDKYNSRITDLDSKCNTLQERCSSLLEMLDTEKQESYEWKRKYEEIFAKVREMDNSGKGKMINLKSEDHEAEARIVAANEKARSAQEEAREWIAKYSAAANEITVIKNEAALMLERSTEEAKLREAALQAKISEILLAKDREIKDMAVKLEDAEERLTALSFGLKDMEERMVNFVMESSDCKSQIEEFANRVQVVEDSVQSVEKKAEMVAQDGIQLDQKYVTELKRSEETKENCKVSHEEIIIANEFIETARSQLLSAQNELQSCQLLAAERLSRIDIEHRRAAILQRQNDELAAKVERLLASEANATSKVSLLNAMVKEKDKEMESLKQKYEQSVPQILAESLEADHAEAIKMPKTPSLEQGKTDRFLLDSEYSSEPAIVATNESPVRAKRSTVEISDVSFDSPQGTVTDENMFRELKKPKLETSVELETPLQKCTFTPEEDSVPQQNQGGSETPNAIWEDHSKYTMKKLRSEICGNGFTAELLALKNPKKKDLVALYENLVMKK